MCDCISDYLTGAQAKIIIQVCNQNIFVIFLKSLSSCMLAYFFSGYSPSSESPESNLLRSLFVGKLKEEVLLQEKRITC